jgi:hypothetical protein
MEILLLTLGGGCGLMDAGLQEFGNAANDRKSTVFLVVAQLPQP